MANAGHNITTADFVDAMRDTLIQRVSLVMPLADELWQGNHINDESYANIQAKPTTQSRMRELYKSLNNEPSKAAIYEALKRYEVNLVIELEENYRRQGQNITTDATDATDFVDAMRDTLIQRACLVMSLADALLQGKHINDESYANIQAEHTTQNRMRQLYRSLNNEPSKAAFYEALKKYNGFLVRELKENYRRQDAVDVVEDMRTKPNENSPLDQQFDGLHRVDDETRTKLQERWLKNSNKYQTKFQEFIKDRDLKSLGNGKLFLRTDSKYQIGSGAAGTQVYIGMRDDGTEVAVKQMVKNYKQLKDEMKVLCNPRMDNKNIVRYIDFTEDPNFYYLCLQLCECDFEEYQEIKKLDQDALKKVMKEVLLGLQALHNARIIHRDLKPRNILIDVEGNARLADFGISRMINQGASTVYTSRAGTRGWEAAEILNTEGTCGYKRSTDIQVAGMVMYYILSGGKHPFGKEYKRELNILEGNYQLGETTDVEAKDLIEKMIVHEPKARLSIKEAVEHPYFWDDKGRDGFLREIGDMEQVQNCKVVDAELSEAVRKYEKFSDWRSKITDFTKFEKNIPNNLLGLLRFLRNRLVHEKAKFYQNNMYKEVFPEFYISANQLAKDMRWK